MFVNNFSIVQRKGLQHALVLGFITPSIIFLFLFDPASSIFYAPCIFHKLTGFCCPGCGSLRALHQILHGNLVKAFGLNPLMVLSLPFLGYVFLSRVVLVGRKRSKPGVFIPDFWIWIIGTVILGFWILRNIPLYPFSLLTP